MNTENKQDETKGTGSEGSGRCNRCHRMLKDPESIRIGLGRICLQKLGGGSFTRTKKDKSIDNQIDMSGKPMPPPVFTFNRTYQDPENELEIGDISTNVPHWLKMGHSSDFEWAYEGSGPAELAANIIGMFVGPEAVKFNPGLYQDFKRKFIAALPKNGGQISRKDVEAYLANKLLEIKGGSKHEQPDK